MADDIFSRFARSWELIQASASVLRSDAELLVLPALSGIATLIVGGAFVWLAMDSSTLAALEDADTGSMPLSFYGWLFAFYFVLYFIVYFFNTALAGAAIARLTGADPTLSSALALAANRVLPILGYALISATLGVLLRMIAERLGFLGRLIEGGLGLAWTVATFLVVPVLAAEGVGPIKAISRSTALLGETWGENIIGNSGISLVTSVASVVIVLLGFGAFALVSGGNIAAGVVVGAISAVAMLALILVASALSVIYSGAVYYFALTGEAPRGFDPALIRGSFTRKDME